MSLPSRSRNLTTSQITVAAESMVAAQFALSGFDILDHPGRARAFYDLCVARAGGMLKLSVHASLNGFWDLVDQYLDRSQRSRATSEQYHRAIDLWLEHHSSQVMCCLVEFEPADLFRMPRIYLAGAPEVAAEFHEKIAQLACEDLGPLGLDVVHRIQSLPPGWRFSQARIAEIMDEPEETGPVAQPALSAEQLLEGERTGAYAATGAPLVPILN